MSDSYTEQYVSHLLQLSWDTSLPDYYTTLPKGIDFPASFYHSVQLINSLAIIGNIIYQCLPSDHPDRQFLDYFMGIAYISEQFIWNQPGLMQCYYQEGIAWQRGIMVDPTLTKTSDLPILSSSVVDCVIALVLKYNPDLSLVLWLAAEQQNYASTELFTKAWSYPVKTDSNPVLFVNADGTCQNRNPHRLSFGWLGLSTDLVTWMTTPDKHRLRKYISQGKIHWKRAFAQMETNYALLAKIPPGLEHNYGWLGSHFRSHLEALLPTTLAKYHSDLEKYQNLVLDFINQLPSHAKLFRKGSYQSLTRLTYDKAKTTLTNIFDGLLLAKYCQPTPRLYRSKMLKVADMVQKFYAGPQETGLLFWNPRVRCVNSSYRIINYTSDKK